MLLTYNAVIELEKGESTIDKITCVIGDGNVYRLNVQVQSDSEPADLTGHTARIVFSKPDGNTVFQDMIIDDAAYGAIHVVLDNQVYATAGTVKAEILLYSEEIGRLTSGTFTFAVRQGLLNDGTVESTSEFSALDEALDQINTALGQVQDTIVIQQEIIDARGTFDNLKDRLDNVDTEITDRYTKAEVDTAINDIKIGGRNYIQHGDCETQLPLLFNQSHQINLAATISQDFKYSGSSSLKITTTALSTTDRNYQCGSYVLNNLVPGQQYTFSAWVYIPSSSGIIPGRIYLQGLWWASADGYIKGSPATKTDSWEKLFVTFTPPLDSSQIWVRINIAQDISNVSFYVDELKLEIGNKATDWTPAPEDVQSQIGDLAVLSTTAKDSIVNALNEVFNEVNNGKTSIYGAIVDKGVTPTSQEFADLVTAIGAITTGGDVTIEGTATAPDILEGKTATVPSGVITGTMPNYASDSSNIITYNDSITTIYYGNEGRGYYAHVLHKLGKHGYIDENTIVSQAIFGLNPSVIKTGHPVGKSDGSTGVGTFTADATAVAGDIATGKTAYVNGAKVTGTSTADPNVGTHLLETSVTATGNILIGDITGITFLPIAISWDANDFIANGSDKNSFMGMSAVSRDYHWDCSGYMIYYVASDTVSHWQLINPHEYNGTVYPFTATKQTDGTYTLHFDFTDNNPFASITSTSLEYNFTLIG